MDHFTTRIKTAFEARLGREIPDSQVAEIELWFRQLAALIDEWSRDEAFCRRLAVVSEAGKAQGEEAMRAATHATDNTRGHPRGFP